MAAPLDYILTALAINALVGAAMFEWAWHQMKAIREINEERDGRFPAYRRWDAERWKKWKFYPGAITLLPVRIFVVIILISLNYICIRVGTMGHSFAKGEPIRGKVRNWIIGNSYKFFCLLLLLTTGCWSWRTSIDFDYSPYLGEGYKANIKGPNNVSTYVCNHSGWVDIVAMVCYFRPAFAAKKALKKVPFFGRLVQALGCILISRGGTLEERN